MKITKADGIATFCKTIATLFLSLILINHGIPFISRKITGLKFPLPVPGILKVVYWTLTFIAVYVYVSHDDQRREDFLRPSVKFLKGHYGKTPRLLFLIIIPLLFGRLVYLYTLPKAALPVSMRVQHPSSNFPRRFENLENPFRNPSKDEIDRFIKQVKTERVEFITQTGKAPGSINFISTASVQEFLKELKEGLVDKKKAMAVFIEKNLFEGRILYQINCRPCHGVNGDGNGPMADGFKLRPIDFTESGTIEILVEGYTFWRVSTGWAGLPIEATPWDSAMPEWRTDLTDEEIWKILLAVYDMAGKSPRIQENLE